MARTRIFVSSTFFDLKQIRVDLERFINGLGYDAVLTERGTIPYLKDEALENSCYREVSNVDILVALIGGRFGTTSHSSSYSVTQLEIKTALQLEKPVYVFIDRSVFAEYETYKKNKGNASVDYASVDNRLIFAFIEELYALPNNNPIAPFDGSREVTDYLREQWAGLFQRFLSEQHRKKETSLVFQMQNTAKTLNQLVEYLTEERRDKDQAIRDILLTTHSIFGQLRSETKNSYRVFFETKSEMEAWLSARLFSEVEEPFVDSGDYYEWSKTTGSQKTRKVQYLHVAKSVFDEAGKLKSYSPSQWNAKWVYSTFADLPEEISDDDIPF